MLPSVMRRKRTLPYRSSNAAFSTSRAVPSQQSPHIGFYKTFGRPIAKVLLMATFTYQLSYWLWVKLEKDEIKSIRQAEISVLEAKLEEVIASTK